MSFGFEHEFDTDISLKEPGMYKVILHNDDYTTMEFVVFILTEIFNKKEEDAQGIMLDVHKKGFGVAGIYVYDIARTKVEQVHLLAKKNNFPLLCTIEEV